MNKNLSQKEKNIWHHLVESYMSLAQAEIEFSSEEIDRVSIIREGFRRGDVAVALYVANNMKDAELCQLFDELIFFSTSPAYAGACRDIILSLPREWVLSNIENAVKPVLSDATDNEYRRILELYSELDSQLVSRLAQQAILHSDEDIREAGKDFLNKGRREGSND